MKPTPLTPLQAFRRSVQMVLQAAPRELRNLALLNLVTGTGPSVSLFLNKVVIDEASRLLARGTTESVIPLVLSEPKLLWSLVGTVLIGLIIDAIDSVGNTFFAALRDRVRGHVQGQVLQKIANFDDIALFESPDLLNLVELTSKGIQRLQQLSFIVAATLVGISIFVPSMLVSISIAWWVPLVLVASSIPSIIVEVRFRKKSWRVEETQASLSREMDLQVKMLTGEAYAKELRLFSLQSVLLERWRSQFRQMFSTMQRVRREGALAVMLWSLVSGLGSSLPYVYVMFGVLQGRFTLGDLALYTGIILQLYRSLFIMIGNIGEIYDVVLATSPIFQLLDLEPQLHSGPQRMSAPFPTTLSLPDQTSQNSRTQIFGDQFARNMSAGNMPAGGIHLEQVSFAYPGSDKPILKQINLTIHPGEMVALVGENGAGKTTLAKLLCRLYDPSEGAIYWNKQDLRSLDLTDLRSRIAVVMQDYARFPTSLRENVGWGYLPDLQTDSAIHAVLQAAGIDQVVEELKQGLETPLGKQLENGMDLSGGQWQRLAIARALMRLPEAGLLVFDEPTAALDPKNEHEIYHIFKTIAQGRMAVVVSHRLALARLADRIIVLEQGEIIESGTHDQLMQQGVQAAATAIAGNPTAADATDPDGTPAKEHRYYTMFTRQASSYV